MLAAWTPLEGPGKPEYCCAELTFLMTVLYRATQIVWECSFDTIRIHLEDNFQMH